MTSEPAGGRTRKNSTRATNPHSRSEAEEKLLSKMESVPARKYKKRHLKCLEVEERTAIIYEYLVECCSQEDIARRHRVSAALVGRLTKAMKKNPEMIQELKEKRLVEEEGHKRICDSAREMLAANRPIWKAQQLQA